MQATAFEYRHRYLIHGLIYTFGFAAPWAVLLPPPYKGAVWSFLQNKSTWFLLADRFSRPLYTAFAGWWNATLIVMILFGAAGAALRTWGAAYLGASTVQRGGMVSDRIVADGPYRFVRNPLYLGTLLHSVALAFLMRPDAAVLTMVLLTLVQLRLIGREEPYLLERQGEPYADYLTRVPRLLPSLRSRTPPGNSRPNWMSGVLSEVYVLGTVVTLVAVGWSRGFAWENSALHVIQGTIIALGASVIARAFIPKATY